MFRGLYETAPNPSGLLTWYQQEKTKRSQGLINEIDLNEILAAARGVKNLWHAILTKHPEEFKPILDDKFTEIEWGFILQLRKGETLDQNKS